MRKMRFCRRLHIFPPINFWILFVKTFLWGNCTLCNICQNCISWNLCITQTYHDTLGIFTCCEMHLIGQIIPYLKHCWIPGVQIIESLPYWFAFIFRINVYKMPTVKRVPMPQGHNGTETVLASTLWTYQWCIVQILLQQFSPDNRTKFVLKSDKLYTYLYQWQSFI